MDRRNAIRRGIATSAAAGADGHIAKPIRVEALFAALEQALPAQAA